MRSASLSLALRPREAGKRVGELSMGQQRRLDLALVLAMRPHVLLLDEPTNHLQLRSLTNSPTHLERPRRRSSCQRTTGNCSVTLTNGRASN